MLFADLIDPSIVQGGIEALMLGVLALVLKRLTRFPGCATRSPKRPIARFLINISWIEADCPAARIKDRAMGENSWAFQVTTPPEMLS